ncbi:hypothetical protein TCDM_13299 [Trypanosoma cruzi Dm28c]|uniref:Uncharacterized protein n=1 Tax=Trypanosoma cruzi Dm28c TaxID=1416333 RepID=V5ANM3_TRYCR|nr:hypothetical protein TCDM_13299 [Trypanosoma cruzi Dm28c]
MRGAQGRRHERVGGCACGAVGRKHTAPLAGRVQQQTKGKSRKENTSTVIAPKSKKEKGMKEMRDESKKLKIETKHTKKKRLKYSKANSKEKLKTL